jgi:capsular exopolysaccharide synthesis family protein
MIPGLNKRVLNFHDLMLYIALVRKHLRLMVLLVCMSLLFGVVLYTYSRPVYFSHSTVLVDSLSLPLDTDKVYHDGSLGNIISELKGPEVLARTAARLGTVIPNPENINEYLRELRITPDPSGNLDVQVWSYQRSWPARWTEIMVEEFMKLRAEQRERFRETVMRTYGSELAQLKDKIDTDQETRYSFEDQSKFTEAQIDAASLHDLPAHLAQVKQRIDQLDSIRDQLDNPNIDTVDRLSIIASADSEAPVQIGQTASLPPGVSMPSTDATSEKPDDDPVVTDSVIVPGLIAESIEWQQLEKRQRELLKQRADLSLIYKPGNLKMVAVDKGLADAQRNLDLDYEVARNRFDIVYRSLQDHYTDLENELPQYEQVNRKYAKIQADAQLHQAGQLGWSGLYEDADKTISQVAYAADREKVNLRYGHMVELKSTPVAPNKLKLTLIALGLGLVLAVVVPFSIEYLDYTLSNLEEVEATFKMRGLGIIPQVPQETTHPILLDISASSDSRNLIENFRIVRTNLLAMGAISKPAQVVMVTSAVPKEGKTVVSSNLSISFGQTGARTLLIDSDLRRGRLHRLFGLRKSPGLSDYLLGKVTLDQAIRPSGKENVSILSAGEHVESGTELLGSPKFSELMAHLRTEYERIIVDTPPVLGLSETSVLQNPMDGVLFVIWSGRTPIRNMKTAVDILAANGANFYGFILNRLDLSSTTNYYQYYYYSSDYYHSYHALEHV